MIWTADLVPIQYERDLVADVHVQYRRPDAIYLYDRLYCSYEFIAWHVQRQEHFVIRCPLKSTFRLVEEFADDPTRDDELVTLSVPHERRAVIRERELPKDVTVRLVKITLPSGGVEVLMTSLVDDEAFPREAIGELYAMRWGAETSINYLKTVMATENWSGRTHHVILQDFYSTVFLFSLANVLSARVNHELARDAATVPPLGFRAKARRAHERNASPKKKGSTRIK